MKNIQKMHKITKLYLNKISISLLLLIIAFNSNVNYVSGKELPKQPNMSSTSSSSSSSGSSSTSASTSSTNNNNFGSNSRYTQFGQNCDTEYSVTCIKLDIVGFIEKLSHRREFIIMPGISVVRDLNQNGQKTADIISEISRSFPNDADKRLDGFIITKLGNFLQSLSLRMKLSDNTEIESEGEFTGRRSKIAKKGGLEAIIAAGMMMKGMLFTIAMGALAALAGKALMTGLMALMLSAIVGLKSLASGGHKSTTYEIVAKPVHQVSHSHSVSHEDLHGGHGHSGHGYSGGYGRSLNIVLPDHLKDPTVK